MWAASEINASEFATRPMTTSTAMNATIRLSAIVNHLQSASADNPCEWSFPCPRALARCVAGSASCLGSVMSATITPMVAPVVTLTE